MASLADESVPRDTRVRSLAICVGVGGAPGSAALGRSDGSDGRLDIHGEPGGERVSRAPCEPTCGVMTSVSQQAVAGAAFSPSDEKGNKRQVIVQNHAKRAQTCRCLDEVTDEVTR